MLFSYKDAPIRPSLESWLEVMETLPHCKVRVFTEANHRVEIDERDTMPDYEVVYSHVSYFNYAGKTEFAARITVR